jgi:uncharacterized protein YodC (DUF2158 family)
MAKFKVGTVVRLKSGGPQMTIEKYVSTRGESTDLVCKWFVNEKIEVHNFEEEALEMIETRQTMETRP